MKKVILLLSALTLLSILLIAILYIQSERTNSQFNGFNRTIDSTVLQKINALPLPSATLYVAGRNTNVIYFGDRSDAPSVTFTNPAFTATHQLQLNLSRALKAASANLIVRDTHFYLTDYITPSFYNGELFQYEVNELTFDSAYFDLAIPLNNKTIVGRVVSSRTMANILFKHSHAPERFEKHYDLLDKQGDNIFSTDGMLIHNDEKHQLFYTYYYRNTFLCLDTALNVLYTAHTIDTTSTARMKSAHVTSDETITMASPPFFVNARSVAAGNYLFIQSELRGDNEDEHAFDHSSVIDVYHSTTGSYVKSFYLPEVNGVKSQDFYVYNDTLISIHEKEAVRYRMVQRGL